MFGRMFGISSLFALALVSQVQCALRYSPVAPSGIVSWRVTDGKAVDLAKSVQNPLDQLGKIADKAGKKAKEAGEATEDAAKDAGEATTDTAGKAGNAAKDAGEATTDAAKDAGEATTDAAGDAGDAAKDAGKATKDTADSVGDAAKKKVEGTKKRKPMDPIESMRAMMCWGRPKLIEHEKCMNWMTKHCTKETTTEGYCKKLRKYVKKKCVKGSQKACGYAERMGIDVVTVDPDDDPEDSDGDGVKDSEDEFPDNPLEWKDSDGDGVGDNSDIGPHDPTCADVGDICRGGPGPAPGVAASPVPAPAPAPGNMWHMNENIPLPSQGYNEFSNSHVAHNDGTTMTHDWRTEWPLTGGDEESSIQKICSENPNHAWCKLKNSKAARRAYVISHP